MKRLLLLLAALLAVYCCAAQTTIRGSIADAETGNPLAYATVGIMDTPVGCVADKGGVFSLTIPEILDDLVDSLGVRVALVGYEPQYFLLSDLTSRKTAAFRLTPTAKAEREPVVIPKKTKQLILGTDYTDAYYRPDSYRDKKSSMFMNINQRGFECGVLFNLKKPSLIEKVDVTLKFSGHEQFVYRINIYQKTEDGEFVNILDEPIYGYCSMSEEFVATTVDISDRGLVLQGEVLVAFEYVDNLRTNMIEYPTSYTGTTSLGRKSSEDSWTESFLEGSKTPGFFPLRITVLEFR